MKCEEPTPALWATPPRRVMPIPLSGADPAVWPSPQPLSQGERGLCLTLAPWERVAEGRVRERTDGPEGTINTMCITRPRRGLHRGKGNPLWLPLQIPSPLPWRERARACPARDAGVRGSSSLFLSVCLVLFCLFSSPPAFAQNDLQTGIRLFEAGQLVEARQLFEALHQQQPTDTSAPFYLGRIAYAEKNYEQAIPWFKMAVDGEPCNADYHVWLGRAYGQHVEQMGMFGRLRNVPLVRNVRTHLEKAVGCDPTHTAAHWDLMRYYLEAPGFLGGSRKKAQEQAAILTRLDPAEGQKARQFIAEWD